MDNNKKLIILLSLSIFIVIISTAAITYAYISVSDTQEEANVINTACFDTDFTDSNVINDLGYPMSSATALKKTPYTFTLTNKCNTNTTYEVILNVISTTNIDLKYINYSLDGSTTQKLSSLTPTESLPNEVKAPNTSKSFILKTDSVNGINTTKTDKVYLWIDDSAGNDIMGQKFEASISIYSKAG